jgi:acetate kinase
MLARALMVPHVLVINCGSSSIKLALLEPKSGAMPWHALAERLGASDARVVVTPDGEKPRTLALSGAEHAAALDAALKELPQLQLAAVGHRVVHGGEAFTESVVLDPRAIDAIEACSDLAPLHNPANLIGIRAALKRLPELGQVAVFDTAFHHSLPAHAYVYAIPYALYEKHRVRKYGFHGTSHRYVAERAAELLGRPLSELNLVTAHLGNGASAAAVRGGKSVDTTMGLTPLEGLVMGTRSGDVDPNLHQFLVEHAGMTLEQVTDLLNKESGLLGLSGASNDMRNLLQLEAAGNTRAKLAIDVFCYRLAKGVLGLCAALPSLDALVFTGGIGENAAPVRERAVRALSILGLRIDAKRNEQHGKTSGGIVSEDASPIRILVVPTNEELVIAREAVRLLKL